MAVYRDSFERRQRWADRLAFLNWSIPLGAPFGVAVRVAWTAPALFLLFAWYVVRQFEFGPSWTWVSFAGWLVVFPVLLCLTIYTHEMMHIVAGWRYRIRTPLITLSALGGLAHMDSPARGPRSEMFVAAAGPAVHLVWLAALYPLSLVVEPTSGSATLTWLGFVVDVFCYLNLVLLVFNLLPFYPMDGGRILRGLLAMRMHPNRAAMIAARVGLVGAVLIAAYGIYERGPWTVVLIAIGAFLFLACLRTLKEVRYQLGPYGEEESRSPWEGDPDAWKRPADGVGEREPARPGFFARWRARRRREREEREGDRVRRREKREAERRHELEAAADRVLARIAEVGIENLTAEERAILDRASRVGHGEDGAD